MFNLLHRHAGLDRLHRIENLDKIGIINFPDRAGEIVSVVGLPALQNRHAVERPTIDKPPNADVWRAAFGRS